MMTFISTLFAVLVAYIIKDVFIHIFSIKEIPITFINPEKALEASLGRYLRDVADRLPDSRRYDCFPIRFDLFTEDTVRYATLESVQIISALLEQKGWIVTKDDTCQLHQIILDVPRKNFK